MAQQLFANNARATLSGTLSIGGLTLNLAAGQGNQFPTPSAGDYFFVTLYEKDSGAAEITYEIVKCTSRTADTLTIVRDVEGIVGVAGGNAYPSAIGVNPSQVVYVELRHTAYAAGNTLNKDDNLASLDNASTARTNLGLGTAATTAATAYATSAQGAKADTALQPAAVGTTVQAFSANLSEYAAVNPTAVGLALLDDVDVAAQRTTLGLGNVDNTSDATKNAAAVALTNKTIVAASNTITTAASGNLAATSLNAALAELQSDIDTRATSTALTTHTGLVTDAHDASAISYLGSTNLVAANVEAALDELDTEKVAIASIGVTVQAYNANLATYGATAPTVAGLALLDDLDAAAQRTTLGLGTAATTAATAYATAAQGTTADSALQPAAIGTTVQAYNANLATYGATAPTVAGLALLDDLDAAAQRTTLGLGTAATTAATAYATAAQGTKADSALQPAAIGTTVQAYDAQLADVAGLTPTNDGVIIGNGTNFVVESGATLKTSLGLTIGTNVQAYSANLDEYAAVNPTAAGLALLDDVDATAQRLTLGLGSLATQSGTFSGTSSGTNTGDQSLFSTVAVAGQSNVVADATSDTLTLVAGSNVTITTDAATDTITIASSGGGGAAADGDYGDITVSGTGTVWNIDAGVVTTTELGGDITTAGKALLDDADASAQRTTLGLAIGTDVQAYDVDTAKLDVAQSWTAQQTFKELKDTVFTITDAAGFSIDPANGSIQTITLGANRTPVATNFEAGQVVLLGIDDGTAFTITWTTVAVTWVKAGGTASAPTLATTGFTWVLLWEVGSTIYGLEVGKP